MVTVLPTNWRYLTGFWSLLIPSFKVKDPILNNQFDTALNHSETHYFNPPGQDNSQQHHSFDALPDTFGLDHPQPNVNRAPETTSMSALDFQSDRLLTIHRNENSVTTPQEASPSGICVTPMSLPVTTRSESQPNPATAGPRLVCSIPGCPQANKPFTRNSSLKRHMLRHRPSPTLKEFKCPNPGCKQAKRGFPRKDGLDRHRLKCKFRIGSYAQLTPSSSASCTSSGTLGALRPNRDASGGVIRRATSRQRAKVEGWKQEHKKRLEALEEKERECGEERARLEELACRIRELDEPDDEDLEEDST
ncbi:hypothetical protein B0T21DRAFT_409814 [Apiosordaria backusii]|uniref:C2H2-type domain-containing protein n=1 Tax=Apiosordaria backusii TaxID=314023 RepID=A0AA40BSB4_9PEZI|nr:hypothetical protein B0T21DRAFT_409814 [Apiosordaria backusii]